MKKWSKKEKGVDKEAQKAMENFQRHMKEIEKKSK